MVPVGSVCGTCKILAFDDVAPSGSIGLTTIGAEPESADYDLPMRFDYDDLFLAGAGRWRDDQHTFYYRSKLLGLGLNWKRTLAKFVRCAALSR